MKWFKHDSNANTDAKLKRVKMKHGMEGYGLYWYCLELIAQNVEAHNLTFELEHDAELIAVDTGIHKDRIQEIMTDFSDWGLFENVEGVITCLKMAKRTDEYTQKLIKNQPTVGILSGQNHDSIGIKSVLIEEKRTEEKRTDVKSKFTKDDFSLAEKMYESLLVINPKHKAPNLENWANSIRLLREVDNRTLSEISKTWEWANKDSFWRTNILSPDKLRKQMDKLTLTMSSETSISAKEEPYGYGGI